MTSLDAPDYLIFGGTIFVGVGIGWWINWGCGLAVVGGLMVGLGVFLLAPSVWHTK